MGTAGGLGEAEATMTRRSGKQRMMIPVSASAAAVLLGACGAEEPACEGVSAALKRARAPYHVEIWGVDKAVTKKWWNGSPKYVRGTCNQGNVHVVAQIHHGLEGNSVKVAAQCRHGSNADPIAEATATCEPGERGYCEQIATKEGTATGGEALCIETVFANPGDGSEWYVECIFN